MYGRKTKPTFNIRGHHKSILFKKKIGRPTKLLSLVSFNDICNVPFEKQHPPSFDVNTDVRQEYVLASTQFICFITAFMILVDWQLMHSDIGMRFYL